MRNAVLRPLRAWFSTRRPNGSEAGCNSSAVPSAGQRFDLRSGPRSEPPHFARERGDAFMTDVPPGKMAEPLRKENGRPEKVEPAWKNCFPFSFFCGPVSVPASASVITWRRHYHRGRAISVGCLTDLMRALTCFARRHALHRLSPFGRHYHHSGVIITRATSLSRRVWVK